MAERHQFMCIVSMYICMLPLTRAYMIMAVSVMRDHPVMVVDSGKCLYTVPLPPTLSFMRSGPLPTPVEPPCRQMGGQHGSMRMVVCAHV